MRSFVAVARAADYGLLFLLGALFGWIVFPFPFELWLCLWLGFSCLAFAFGAPRQRATRGPVHLHQAYDPPVEAEAIAPATDSPLQRYRPLAAKRRRPSRSAGLGIPAPRVRLIE